MASVESGLLCCWGWDDPQLIAACLRPKGGRLLVASRSGDVALSMIGAGARSVTAVCEDSAQAALLELKLAGARTLPAQTLHSLLGMDAAGRRVFLYHLVREGAAGARGHRPGVLTPDAAAWWDGHEGWIRQGLSGLGRRERAAARLRRLLVGVGLDRDVRASLEGAPARWGQSRRWRGAVTLAFRDCLSQVERTQLTRRLPLLAGQGAEVARRVLAGGVAQPAWLQPAALARLSIRPEGDSDLVSTTGALLAVLQRHDAGCLDGIWLGHVSGELLPLAAASARVVRPGGVVALRLPDQGRAAAAPGWTVDASLQRRLLSQDRAVLSGRLQVLRRS